MTKRIFFCLALIVAAALPLRAAPQGNGESPEMRRIVASLKMLDQYEVDVSKFPKPGKLDDEEMKAMRGLEVYRLPVRNAADAFIYNVYYDSSRGKYWLSRSGGVAGVAELYGPMDVPAR